MPAVHDDLRVQLEGRLERLEAAVVQYRGLVRALRSIGWRGRVRRNATLVRDVATTVDEVTEALHRLHQRAPQSRLAHELLRLREELVSRLAQRLVRPVTGLREGLESLELEVVMARRRVVFGQRRSTARAVLPATLPELKQAHALALLAEQRFSNPAPLSMSLDALETFAAAWSPGVLAIEQAWQRVVQVDATGSLVRHLKKRSRQAPSRAPEDGPALLCFATYWIEFAQARIDALLVERFDPVLVLPEERFEVLRWAWHREHRVSTTLNIEAGPRRALLELAAAVLSAARETGYTPLSFAGLLPLAREADRLAGTDAWRLVFSELQVLLRVVAPSGPQTRPTGLEDTLRALQRSSP